MGLGAILAAALIIGFLFFFGLKSYFGEAGAVSKPTKTALVQTGFDVCGYQGVLSQAKSQLGAATQVAFDRGQDLGELR